jgi:hypothetical protein
LTCVCGAHPQVGQILVVACWAAGGADAATNVGLKVTRLEEVTIVSFVIIDCLIVTVVTIVFIIVVIVKLIFRPSVYT